MAFSKWRASNFKDIISSINCRSLKDNSIRYEPAQCLRIMMRRQQLGADVYNSNVNKGRVKGKKKLKRKEKFRKIKIKINSILFSIT